MGNIVKLKLTGGVVKNTKMMQRAFKLSTFSVLISAAGAQAQTVDCTNIDQWLSGQAYTAGQTAQKANQAFKAKWWTQADPLTHSGPWQEWETLGACSGTDVPNENPMVLITEPGQNTVFTEKDSVVIKADASDADGTVKQVEFFANGQLISSDASAPYSAQWLASVGDVVLTAIVEDDKGARVTSSAVAIKVNTASPGNQAPQTLLSITSGTTSVNINDSVVFGLSGQDTDGQVVSLELFENGQSVSQVNGASGEFTFNAAAVGRFEFTLVAKDDLGATTTSSAVVINVKDATTPPDDDRDNCKPEGLYQTPGVNTPYCTVYDANGREEMGADHPRRVIGYFTSWRTGKNDQPSYLAKDIPWDKITHINYAFAHVDAENKVSIGNPNAVNNAATNMEWPGVEGAEMDPSFSYTGHFNLLNKYKKLHPDVKTLISVGGWAETGGYFGADGNRVASGGFYTMTTNADGSINHAGIDAFAKSSVEFIQRYGFDGVDIDYEYPSSMNDAGHPDDFPISNARRAGLNASYNVLMKRLREELDMAGEKAGKHYMLTIASPSSGYLLRGMETFQATQYLDYVNIMSYDLHGAWNDHVGHNAALYDTGKDSELAAWNVYGTKEFEGIGYLNTDWAVTYFRGALSAGRINIGVPYYTRGFKDVSGGTDGLWGRAPLPNQADCPVGTGKGEKNNCGNGAVGIDNLWHDLGKNNEEIPAGSNPLWHVKNLQNGILPSYLGVYGLDPANVADDQLVGTYARKYDSVAVAPWLWNAEKKVFLSIEDEESMATKVDYIINKGLGGIMFWELAGDFDYDAVKKEYFMGSTMTSIAYNKFSQAAGYDINKGAAEFVLPAESVDISFETKDFPVGDKNYPISPTFAFTNHSVLDLSGAKISFDVPVSTSAIFKSNWNAQEKLGMVVEKNASNAAGNNIGGYENEFHRFSITLVNEFGSVVKSFLPGETINAQVMYYMPITGPVNFTIEKDGKVYAAAFEYPHLPAATQPGNGGGGGNADGTCEGVKIADIPVYPDFPRKDWAGNPSHANAGDLLVHNNGVFKAKWWTATEPGTSDWTKACSL
ncbi:chitinase [Pseudoalteromonas ulvae UL12]|nr:chitinase [Pseudoalteromonas ulvae UL12]